MVVFADELADGAKGAALPLIRHSLGLSYAQVGLLTALPLLAGGLLELPLGLVAGEGRRRRIAVLGGGVLFAGFLAATAFAQTFPQLLLAFIGFYPASGAFVSLTQAELMDTWPDRQARHMARWDFAGSAGAVAGPLLLAAVVVIGGGWRGGYLVLAALSGLAWLGMLLRGAGPAGHGAKAGGAAAGGAAGPGGAGQMGWMARTREVLAAIRAGGTVRWLVLIEVANLLVDVLTGFLALYVVTALHVTPAVAALAVAVRLGAGLAGDAMLVVVLERVGDLAVLRATAIAAAALYPAFLLVPGLVAKLAVLAVLSTATAAWYPLLQARMYGSLPGRSPVAVTLSSAAGMAAAAGPLTVGLLASAFGLAWALTGLAAVPLAVLTGSFIRLKAAAADRPPRT